MTTRPRTTTQVYELYIHATPEQMWDAITNPETIAKYFHGAQIDDGPLEVGAARKSWSPDRSQLWGDNTILECDPPHRYAHTWRSLYDEEMAAEDESRVTWEIEPADVGVTQADPHPRPARGRAEDGGQRDRLVVHPEQSEDRPRDGRAVRGA